MLFVTNIFYFSFISFCLSQTANKPSPTTSENLAFIENNGQIIDQNNKPNPGVLYLLNTPRMNVQLRKSGFSYDVYEVKYKANPQYIKSDIDNPSPPRHISDSLIPVYYYHRIDIHLEGINPDCAIIPSDPLPDYFNYFTSSAPPEGIKNVGQFTKITYKEVYPGIDLEFFINKEHGYKYNFVIHPEGNIRDIRLKITGPENIMLNHDTLKFSTRFGDVEELIPETFYMINYSRVDIKARFEKINNEVYGFSIDNRIPKNSLLVIDPTAIRLWGTYYGGTDWDWEGRCSVDKTGNVFLAGITQSLNNIATSGSYQDTLAGGWDGFLVKFNAAGQRQWGTYFGGTGNEDILAGSVICDKSGNIYVSGSTNSTSGIASTGAHQTVYGGGINDCFIEKFNQAGNRLWGTYYGGTATDIGGAVSTDKNGNVFLSGETASDTGISTPGSYQPNRYNTSADAFISKFDSNGVRQWGTYFGGEMLDQGNASATDNSGNVYLSGITSSYNNIASPGAFQITYGGGFDDAFLAKFTPEGQRVWSTYYGGSLDDRSFDCVSDGVQNISLVGQTNSPNGIASLGCFQPVFGGGYSDAFIVKFDSLGQRLWGTYYGGSDEDEAYGCSIGWNNELFMAGITKSTNNISSTDSYQQVLGGSYDGFLVKFDASGQRQWGTYYGGSYLDRFNKCNYAIDDTIYMAGYTQSSNNIASPGSFQEVFGGMEDCMLIKFLDCWPIDTAGPIIGPVIGCKPSTSVNYSIPPLAHAVNYIWTFPPGYTIVAGAGTNSIFVDLSISASSGTIWVKGVNKCGDFGDSAYLNVTVHQRPVPVISGPNNTCAGPGKVYTTLFGQSNYQWSTSPGGVITSGGTTTDNTATITWNVVGIQHVYVNYTDANGCDAYTPTDYIVQVTTSPSVGITISTTSDTVCSGTLVNFTALPQNGGGNPFYQWKVNGSNVGGNSSAYSYVPLNNDSITCILTSSISGCIMNNPATSNIIIMVVNPILPVGISISASENPFCAGSTITFTATPTNGGTPPSFQWIVNGVGVGSDNPVYSYIPNNGDVVSCVLNSSIPCPTGNPATSNTITMAENTNVAVSVTISPSATMVCEGTSVTFTAAPINGGTLPVYQWLVNGLGGYPSASTMIYVPANGDIVTCVLTSNAACASGNPATSNAVNMVVNPNLPVSVTISASVNSVCAGTSVTFTATPTNGGTSPSYLWKVNGGGVYPNVFTMTYVPANGDIITCVLTSSNTVCVSNNPATSNAISMVVNPLNPVSVSINTPNNPFCQGSTVTFTATPTNGGTTPSYSWKVNGVGVGGNSQNYSYIPANGDLVTCILNSNIACPTGNPATSNTITMIENTVNPVSIVITTPVTTVCTGTSVIFTANPTNGGTTPNYQWKVNGVNTGSNNSQFTYTPVNSDCISCILTSNMVCASGNPATSNSICMTVNPNQPVNISISTPITTVCAGTQVTFTASPTNQGTLPQYQWKVNGVGVGTSSLTYSYVPLNSDQVSCILTSNAICPTGNPATSNTITMTVNANMLVGILISASTNPVCSGISVTYTAIPTNGGTTPVYLWKVNGINAGTNSTTYQYVPVNGDLITCTLASNLTCTSGNPATSNIITMGVAASPVVTLTRCNDSITTTTAQPFRLKGGIPLGGTYSGPGVTNGIFYPAIAGAGTHIITYIYTNAALCSASAIVTIVTRYALPLICGNPLTDIRDNHAYPTIQIGSQCWLASNLEFGTTIPETQNQ
ncbi:MAG: SBBP repeat-containing protein, partial [Bacteroidetes bacterium]|nr:SBBP repeat-containing protein [Bacteroidota bacterium]